MAIRIGREGLVGFQPAGIREPVVQTVHVGTFSEAVDTALALQNGKPAIDIIGLDLDRTYVHWKDVFGHPLQSIGKMGERRELRRKERQDALHKLLEPQEGQHASQLVVWTSRPEWAVPRRLRGEINTIAEEHGTEVIFVGGLDKLVTQRRFRATMTRLVGPDSSKQVIIFGNSEQERRGADWAATHLLTKVHHINVGSSRGR